MVSDRRNRARIKRIFTHAREDHTSRARSFYPDPYRALASSERARNPVGTATLIVLRRVGRRSLAAATLGARLNPNAPPATISRTNRRRRGSSDRKHGCHDETDRIINTRVNIGGDALSRRDNKKTRCNKPRRLYLPREYLAPHEISRRCSRRKEAEPPLRRGCARAKKTSISVAGSSLIFFLASLVPRYDNKTE